MNGEIFMKTVLIGYLPFQEFPDAVRYFSESSAGESFKLAFRSIPDGINIHDLSQCDFLLIRSEDDGWEWVESLLRLKGMAPHLPTMVMVPEGSLTGGYTVMRTIPSIILVDKPADIGKAVSRLIESARHISKRILFVDDDEFFLNIYRNAFLKTSFKVLTASSAPMALEVLHREAVDLVVTDIKMPGMHGLKLIDEIRKIDKSLPIIVCSAYHRFKAESDMYFYNVSSFIEKPIKIKMLKKKIVEILN